ncbi:MAG: MBL fold metallo-hydrolase, partial [Actinobacteria bacterium]|nr:MBL fold metallo-hydrolase [Actinomycetota bacterium]
MSLLRTLLAAGLVSAGLVAHAAAPATLHLEVYNPGAKGVFPVSSEIITGAHEAILI